MKVYLKLSSMLMFALLTLIGCAGQKEMQKQKTTTEGLVAEVPAWYKTPPTDKDYLYNAATAVSSDLQTSVNKARQDAVTGLGVMWKTKVEALFKRFRDEIGTSENSKQLDEYQDTQKQIVSETLEGVEVMEQDTRTEGTHYRAYVLVRMALGKANRIVQARIQQNEDMYTRYQASKAFKELEEEVKKYEESQKKE